MTVAGWERLNDINVGYQPVMNILDDKYTLKSVVTIDSTKVEVSGPDCKDTEKNLIIGANALVRCEYPGYPAPPAPAAVPGVAVAAPPPMGAPGATSWQKYDPLGAALRASGRIAPVVGTPQATPVTDVSGDPDLQFTIETKGTIFMYVKTN